MAIIVVMAAIVVGGLVAWNVTSARQSDDQLRRAQDEIQHAYESVDVAELRIAHAEAAVAPELPRTIDDLAPGLPSVASAQLLQASFEGPTLEAIYMVSAGGRERCIYVTVVEGQGITSLLDRSC